MTSRLCQTPIPRGGEHQPETTGSIPSEINSPPLVLKTNFYFSPQKSMNTFVDTARTPAGCSKGRYRNIKNRDSF